LDGHAPVALDVGYARGGPRQVALRISLGRIPRGFLGALEPPLSPL
jgi:hypothetical protein